jgi:hypothetical protein
VNGLLDRGWGKALDSQRRDRFLEIVLPPTSLLGATSHRGSCFEHRGIRLLRTWEFLSGEREEERRHVVRRNRLGGRAPRYGRA